MARPKEAPAAAVFVIGDLLEQPVDVRYHVDKFLNLKGLFWENNHEAVDVVR
jgi:hypothetical protein